MPEGPEIRRAADKIEAVLKNKTVEKIEFGLQPLKKFAKPLRYSNVLSLETRGKARLTHFDSGFTIYSHNQLYGVWLRSMKELKRKSPRQGTVVAALRTIRMRTTTEMMRVKTTKCKA